MKIDTIDDFTPALQEIAEACGNATFYQTGTWLRAVAAGFPNLTMQCLVAGGGQPIAYLPYLVNDSSVGRKLWSLPFGTYGGPVGTDTQANAALLEAFSSLREGEANEIGVVDFTDEVDLPGFDSEKVSTHVLDLEPGFEAVWSAFEKSKRRQTRKAERDGIEVREMDSFDDLQRYYRVYQSRLQEWHQRIRYPQAMFEYLLQAGKDSVRLFLATLDGEVLGGHLNFYHGRDVIAWNGVTLAGSRGQQASTALYTACIRDACERGYLRYNLGGSLGKTSLESYKEALGGVVHHYRILCWRSFKGRLVDAVKRRLPGR